MTYDLNRIHPQYSAVFLPMDGQFGQDVGANLILDGDMEQITVTPPWTPFNSALLLKDSTNPYSGLRCLEVQYAGTNNPFAQQSGLTNGQVCHITGHAVSDGFKTPIVYFGAPSVWTGTVSTLWQNVDTIATQDASGRFILMSGGAGAGFCRFDDFSVVEHPTVCRSLSKLVGANNYARMGDGHDSNRFPVQLSARGLRFDGSNDYVALDWAAGEALDTHTFTVCAMVGPQVPVTDGRIYEIGVTGQRYSLYYDISEGKLLWQKDDTVDVTVDSGYGYPDGQEHVVIASISSLGMKLWVDGRNVGSVAGDVRLSSYDAATKVRFGRDVNLTNPFLGDMYGTAVYPFEFNAFQVQEWTRMIRQMRNV